MMSRWTTARRCAVADDERPRHAGNPSGWLINGCWLLLFRFKDGDALDVHIFDPHCIRVSGRHANLLARSPVLAVLPRQSSKMGYAALRTAWVTSVIRDPHDLAVAQQEYGPQVEREASAA